MSDYDLFGDYEPEQPATLEEDRPELEPRPSERPRRKRSGGSGGGGFYNFISILFLVGAVGVCVVTVMLIQNPMLPFNPFPPVVPYPTPTLFLLDRGADVGNLALPSPTPAATGTRVPTTLPQETQSQGTPTATLPSSGTANLTSQPAVTSTLSFEPFTLQNEAVTFAQHPDGCDGLWVVGQVFDLDQKPLKGLAIIAKWEGNSAIGWSGYANQWGDSGYEIYLNSKPIEFEVELQLLAGTGQALSEPIVVRTLATCDRNVAIANFTQNHSFSP